MVTRRKECDEGTAAGRFFKAEEFLSAAKVMPHGGKLGGDLRALLMMKTRAGYAAPPVSADQRKRAWRRAENLVEAARSRRAG